MDIVGMDSAVRLANALPAPHNMQIGAGLVIDMAEEIARLRTELEAANGELCREHDRRVRAESHSAYLKSRLGSEDESVWFWQGDGDDQLKRLGSSVAVIIRADDLRHEIAAAEGGAEALLSVLVEAEQFISNGIELGYIKMPDKDTPDPAHETPKKIWAAIDAARGVK